MHPESQSLQAPVAPTIIGLGYLGQVPTAQRQSRAAPQRLRPRRRPRRPQSHPPAAPKPRHGTSPAVQRIHKILTFSCNSRSSFRTAMRSENRQRPSVTQSFGSICCGRSLPVFENRPNKAQRDEAPELILLRVRITWQHQWAALRPPLFNEDGPLAVVGPARSNTSAAPTPRASPRPPWCARDT